MNLGFKWSQIMPENQVNRSQLCVASPHLPQSGEGALQTLRSVGGHDVLLDVTHDLLDSMVEFSGQYNREPNGSHT